MIHRISIILYQYKYRIKNCSIPSPNVMCVIFTVCFIEKSLYFTGKHKKETYF